jgi:hypothetical protein
MEMRYPGWCDIECREGVKARGRTERDTPTAQAAQRRCEHEGRNGKGIKHKMQRRGAINETGTR